jgi:hypothetical protein
MDKILSRSTSVTLDGALDWILDLLTTYTQDSELPTKLILW